VQNEQMNTTLDERPHRPKKTALQQMQEQIERQMRPLRQIEDIQNLLKRHSSEFQLKELARQFEPHRQFREMLERATVPKHIQDIIDGTSVASQAKHMMEQYIPRETLASFGLDNDRLRQMTGLNESMKRSAGLDFANSVAKQYERYLRPTSQQQEAINELRRQSFGGLAAIDFARQLTDSNSALRAIEEARKSLDRLLPTFREVDFSSFESSENDEQEIEQAAKSITHTAAEQESIQQAVERIVIAIQAQQKPSVQLMLWLIFRKVLDWLIAGAIGAVMGYYAPAALGESPQAAKKAIQENAKAAVGSAEILAEYRYVSAKVLIGRQNPKARSPEVGRLYFGRAVKLLKKEKDFALVMWTDQESGTEVQGWVFSRYLAKFK
jgi:hypothetical protein